ncbi:hypothetical protein RRG08_033866 [Elysia crispata]|uniref:Uncharacterized protein n=1 Tax=Elysia crispata TaxID=231223 RepID=A0AAE1B8T2_9GAST|nr:hypothetical protein RRG08_033866 [Elysia crispata]
MISVALEFASLDSKSGGLGASQFSVLFLILKSSALHSDKGPQPRAMAVRCPCRVSCLAGILVSKLYFHRFCPIVYSWPVPRQNADDVLVRGGPKRIPEYLFSAPRVRKTVKFQTFCGSYTTPNIGETCRENLLSRSWTIPAAAMSFKPTSATGSVRLADCSGLGTFPQATLTWRLCLCCDAS